MKCQKCDAEIDSGKRYCSFCGGENIFEGSTPHAFEKNKVRWYKRFKIKLNAMTVFVIIMIIIAVMANMD